MSTKKKVLLVTTVSGFIPQFEMNNVRLLQSMGYEIHYAANYNTPSYGSDNHRLDNTGIIRHQIDFVRSPFKLTNIKVYRQLYTLMAEESFALVHCHTPMGAVMARLAAHATHTGPVVYTAHGFHFYSGASPVYWLCYYPMERFLSRFTDQLLCINKEDYQRAKKSFHARFVNYLPGAGIDLSRLPSRSASLISNKRKELGIKEDAILILSSGELIKRKNHETAIRAAARLKAQKEINTANKPQIQYVICGHGKLDAYLKALAQKLDVADMIIFAGYREDMLEIYQAADIFLFPSYQEGLPMALLEAMACGLPVICSDIRGSRDLMGAVSSKTNGLSYCAGGIMIQKADCVDAYCRAILHMLSPTQDLRELGRQNTLRSHHFSQEKVSQIMTKIYTRLLK